MQLTQRVDNQNTYLREIVNCSRRSRNLNKYQQFHRFAIISSSALENFVRFGYSRLSRDQYEKTCSLVNNFSRMPASLVFLHHGVVNLQTSHNQIFSSQRVRLFMIWKKNTSISRVGSHVCVEKPYAWIISFQNVNTLYSHVSHRSLKSPIEALIESRVSSNR